MKKTNTITQDALDRYVKGNASLDEIAIISLALKEDEDFRNMVSILEDLHKNGSLEEDGGTLPMASMAAMSEGNLCDVLCEQYILKDYLGQESADDSLEVALDNSWLKESGTPLHNMGRLMERHGMTVSRKYDCTRPMVFFTPLFASMSLTEWFGFMILLLMGMETILLKNSPKHGTILRII